MRREAVCPPRTAQPTRMSVLLRAALLSTFYFTRTAAEDFTVKFFVQIDETRHGDFTVTVREKKAPVAAARFRASSVQFYNLSAL